MMNKFYACLKQSVMISLVAMFITSCATVDHLGEKPDDFTKETSPPVSFPEEGDKSTKPLPPTEEIKPSPPSEEKKSTIYVVQQGDTLSSISRRYGHPITELAKWNNLSSPYSLSVGQKLIISSPTATVESPVKEETSSGTYEVVKGDTLSTIAKKYGRTVKELAAWNSLEPPYALKIGQILQVSPKTP